MNTPAPKWKSYPMGAACAERMDVAKQPVVYNYHAVAEPCDKQEKALCGVKTFSLCMDDSLATSDLPDCPRCRAKIARLK